MTWLKVGVAIVELLAALVDWLKQREWYQRGWKEANDAANAEQQKRIADAQAARADHDAFADGRVRDPFDRDNQVR